MDDPKTTRRKWYHWHRSTSLVAILLFLFVILMSVPAKFVDSDESNTLAVHGWPFVHLARSSSFEELAEFEPTRSKLGLIWSGYFEGIVARHNLKPRFSYTKLEHYRGYWNDEQGKPFWSLPGLFLNIATAVVIGLIIGVLLEFRRRHRRKFYHLAIADLLLLIVLPAIWFGFLESEKRALAKQESASVELKKFLSVQAVGKSYSYESEVYESLDASAVPEWLLRASNGKRLWKFRDSSKSVISQSINNGDPLNSHAIIDRKPDHKWPIATRDLFGRNRSVTLGFRSYAKPLTAEFQSRIETDMNSCAKLIDRMDSINEIHLNDTTSATTHLMNLIKPERIRHLTINIVGPPRNRDRPEWMMQDLSFIGRFKNLETLKVDTYDLSHLNFDFPTLPKLRSVNMPRETLDEKTINWLRRQESLQLFSDSTMMDRRALRFFAGSPSAKLKKGWVLPDEQVPEQCAQRIHRIRKAIPDLLIKTLR